MILGNLIKMCKSTEAGTRSQLSMISLKCVLILGAELKSVACLLFGIKDEKIKYTHHDIQTFKL